MVVEYEGSHHQQDREQYVRDLDRYALLRGADISYVQATHESSPTPGPWWARSTAPCSPRGYDGPPPEFGERGGPSSVGSPTPSGPGAPGGRR